MITLSTMHTTKTSEAVSTGHPDAVCDQIGDSIFDYLRTFKRNAQSAVEVAASANKLFIFGEIDADVVHTTDESPAVEEKAVRTASERSQGAGNSTGNTNTREVSKANPQLTEGIIRTARTTLDRIGYTAELYDPEIIVDISTQSAEINAAVEERDDKEPAAGDQGIVTGYAVAETQNYQSLHFILAHEIIKGLERQRLDDNDTTLLPDAKSQVTVEYAPIDVNGEGDYRNKPVAVKHILLSHSHAENIDFGAFKEDMTQRVKKVCQDYIANSSRFLYAETLIRSVEEAEILINPAGPWTTPGPAYDSGLSGRKLVVNNYGSAAPIGGGSSSGKCLNKVDRSGAYFARYVAKSVVASGLAYECLVEIGFAIGVEEPTAVNIKASGAFDTETIKKAVEDSFDFSVKNIIATSSGMDRFLRTSEHGNYTDNSFPWEQEKKIRIS